MNIGSLSTCDAEQQQNAADDIVTASILPKHWKLVHISFDCNDPSIVSRCLCEQHCEGTDVRAYVIDRIAHAQTGVS